MFMEPVHEEQRHKSLAPLVLNVSKKILNRQNIFRNPHHDLQRHESPAKSLVPSILSDQQIKTSQLYEKLQDKLKLLKKQEVTSKQRHRQELQEMQNEISKQKQHNQKVKLSLWELKNQLIELEELLAQEEALCEPYYQTSGQTSDQLFSQGNMDSQSEQLSGSISNSDRIPNTSISNLLCSKEESSGMIPSSLLRSSGTGRLSVLKQEE